MVYIILIHNKNKKNNERKGKKRKEKECSNDKRIYIYNKIDQTNFIIYI